MADTENSTTAVDYQDESLVGIGAPKLTGAVWVAPFTAPLPTNAVDALDEAYKCMGFISDDGVTIGEEGDSQEINAWGGRLVRTIMTTYHENIDLTPIEQNEVALRETYGDENVEVKTENGRREITVLHNATSGVKHRCVIETVPTPNSVTRYVFPNIVRSERGEKTLNGNDAEGRQLTYRAEQDALGNTCYEYTCIMLDATAAVPESESE